MGEEWNHEREWIQRQVDRMKVGQRIVVSGRMFASAFPCGWPSIYETPRQSFLSKQIGSAWGEVTCDLDQFTGDYIIGRNEGGSKRVYVDPDREHWFTKLPSGEYVPRDEPATPSPASPHP